LVGFEKGRTKESDGAAGDQRDWLTLSEASRLLGVAPETLRRWSDRGRVPSFVTVGGHRRFSRVAMLGLLPAERARRPSLAQLGTSSERMTRAYREALPMERRPLADWLSRLEPTQVAEFRSLGTAIAQSLLAHLDAEDPPAALARLEEASALAGDYGLRCGRLELPLSEAVAAFLRFRGPFIDELARTARQRGLDTREATELLVEAQTACDRLLLAFIEAWQQA
jgi:excisionase family DNA binding protein